MSNYNSESDTCDNYYNDCVSKLNDTPYSEKNISELPSLKENDFVFVENGTRKVMLKKEGYRRNFMDDYFFEPTISSVDFNHIGILELLTTSAKEPYHMDRDFLVFAKELSKYEFLSKLLKTPCEYVENIISLYNDIRFYAWNNMYTFIYMSKALEDYKSMKIFLDNEMKIIFEKHIEDRRGENFHNWTYYHRLNDERLDINRVNCLRVAEMISEYLKVFLNNFKSLHHYRGVHSFRNGKSFMENTKDLITTMEKSLKEFNRVVISKDGIVSDGFSRINEFERFKKVFFIFETFSIEKKNGNYETNHFADIRFPYTFKEEEFKIIYFINDIENKIKEIEMLKNFLKDRRIIYTELEELKNYVEKNTNIPRDIVVEFKECIDNFENVTIDSFYTNKEKFDNFKNIFSNMENELLTNFFNLLDFDIDK